ncbi:MAG: carboxyltransferase domain-containing protein [Bacteroidota bacterium]
MSRYLKWDDTHLYIENYNNDFLLLKGDADSSATIAKIGTALFQRKFDFVEEVIVTEVEICLKLNEHFQEAKIGLLSEVEITNDTPHTLWELSVRFHENEDWKYIEQFTGKSRQSIIQQICELDFGVAMFGFLPGFVYFNGLPSSLHIPRKSVPAKYVPAHSLAIGGKYLGVYSIASPGGWWVIGQLTEPILQLPKIPPVQLNLGDRMRLVAED